MNSINTPDQFNADQHMAKAMSIFTAVVMAVVMTMASIKLLSWAIAHESSKSLSVETTSITAALRENQLACLARNIYYEAGGEPFEGKVAVAQVTLNRVKHSQFPNDVCQVIYEKNSIKGRIVCQFSWTCKGAAKKRPANNTEFEESMIVAKKVLLEGFLLPSLGQALYFHADYVNPGWNKTKVAHIGRHIFYK
jgi:spore germination cell wall hydrolase CwlJ-like protein